MNDDHDYLTGIYPFIVTLICIAIMVYTFGWYYLLLIGVILILVIRDMRR